MQPGFDSGSSNSASAGDSIPWYRHLNRYHWFVFVVAALGWLFDTMDQRIFLMSRESALTELLGYERDPATNKLASRHGVPLKEDEIKPADGQIKNYSGMATTVFMLGWATGGLYFGMMGDRWGRARTMLITILIYSAFTGLSALSQTPWDFMAYRFITGLGVGGEFAAGISLVAEVMPAAARPQALGALQALSAVGNIAGSMLGLLIGKWQYMFLVGTFPALLVVIIRSSLKEPESWQKAKDHARLHPEDLDAQAKLGRISELWTDAHIRRNTIIGFLLALSGVIGLWGVGFWSFELITEVVKGSSAEVRQARAIGTTLQDVGAFFGIYFFSFITSIIGRRGAFAGSFALALAATILVFGFMRTESDVYWMLPILGFCNLSVFGGYAIYFPELYPTRLRSTGTGFCYNAARFVAALGPYFLGKLVIVFGTMQLGLLSGVGGVDSPFRYAALSVASIYVLGLLVIPFAPETKGKPLPE